MKKHLYNSYTNNIRNIINKSSIIGKLNEQTSSFTGENNLIKAQDDNLLEPATNLKDLASLLGIKIVKKPFKGDHPDFKHLREKSGVEHHYIVSMFIDVKNSTKLHYNYTLPQISLILQTIIAAATQTCALFGGHIQRLQGDGVFVYFGGKNIEKKKAMEDAVNAAAFFSYFVKYELSEIFELEEINRIYTRIGIDFGDDADVQWAVFGLPNCDEITTNSLHTSLPAKMQSNAPSNGIVLGQNITHTLKDIDTYSDYLRDAKGNIDSDKKYIFKKPDGSFNYEQKNFKWISYLKNNFSFIKADESGRLYIDDEMTPLELKEKDRIALLLKEVNQVKEKQVVFNNSTSRPVAVPPHKFHSDASA
jgi:adenylate cyclase